MINSILIKPSPFWQDFTLEVHVSSNGPAIFRLIGPDDRIIKIFRWYMVKGANITNIDEVVQSSEGPCRMQVIDQHGTLLFEKKVDRFRPPLQNSLRKASGY